MRIAIDLLAGRTTGCKVYCSGFMPALGRLAGNDEFLVFMSPEVADIIESQLPVNFQKRISTAGKSIVGLITWEQLALPRYLQKWEADVLLAPFDAAPLRSPCPILLAIRNPTSALLDGGWLGGSAWTKARARVQHLLAYRTCCKAQLVYYPSSYAARLLGDKMRVPVNRRAVVYHGTDQSFWSEYKEPTDLLRNYFIEHQRFILFASQLYPQKQPDLLVKAFARWQRLPDRSNYKLVLAGGVHNKKFNEKLRRQARDLGIQDATLFLGQVPRSHLAVLYQQAAVFVLPTMMETFGQPFVEAMASGVPIICADTEFARELCGDSAVYFSGRDENALVEALEMTVNQPQLRTKLISTGRMRARTFSWEREAHETLALIKKIAKARN